MEDITFPSQNKERIYKLIMQDKVTISLLEKSSFYEKCYIEERITNLDKIEDMFDTGKFMFLINPKEYMRYTKIRADYLCESIFPEGDCFYFFIINDSMEKSSTSCRGVSFFKRHDIDFRRGTAETKVLLSKKTCNTGKEDEYEVELFRNPNYKP